MKDRTQELNKLAFESKHFVEATMGMVVRPHCTDGSKGTYTLAIDIWEDWEDNHILSTYIGQDALDFLADYKDRLES